jgi:hypothetical protein
VIGEVFDTLLTLGWALAVWITVLAVVVTCVVYGVIAVVVLTVHTTAKTATRAWRLLYGRLPASNPPKAVPEPRDTPRGSQTPSRPAPTRAQHDHKEAA